MPPTLRPSTVPSRRRKRAQPRTPCSECGEMRTRRPQETAALVLELEVPTSQASDPLLRVIDFERPLGAALQTVFNLGEKQGFSHAEMVASLHVQLHHVIQQLSPPVCQHSHRLFRDYRALLQGGEVV